MAAPGESTNSRILTGPTRYYARSGAVVFLQPTLEAFHASPTRAKGRLET